LTSEDVRGLASEDPGVELVGGVPAAILSEGRTSRAPRRGEIVWRPAGEAIWRDWGSAADALGLVDIAWRDGPFTRDRGKAFILPSGAELLRRRQRDIVLYTPVGLDDFALSSAETGLTLTEAGPTEIRASFQGRPRHRASILLRDPRGCGLAVSAPFPQRTGMARWSGEVVAPTGGQAGSPLSLTQLADLIAFGEGRQVLRARLLDSEGCPLSGSDTAWTFEDELPLRSVAADLAELMLPCADIDLRAELVFDGEGDRWLVSQFEVVMRLTGAAISRIRPRLGGQVALHGRAATEPWAESKLADIASSEIADGRPFPVGEGCEGAWIAYLRRGDQVISRPTIIEFGDRPRPSDESLSAALALRSKPEREAAILSRFDAIAAGADYAQAELRCLAQTCASLRGLPPGSLDILRLLPHHPAVAAALLLTAHPGERPAVFALSEGLPFAWYLVPVRCWLRAADLVEAALAERLAPAAGAARARELAQQSLKATAKQLIDNVPLLAWPLSAITCDAPTRSLTPLKQAANDYIQRYGDKSTGRDSLFRTVVAGLPSVFVDCFDPAHLEALDAPCAAAAAAAGQAVLSEMAVRRVKTAFRTDPIYFVQAYDAWFLDLVMTSR
jgi:hypothetical protein